MSHDYPISPDRVDFDAPLCGYCGMPMPEGDEPDAADFCSEACQTAHEHNGASLPNYDADTFYYPGVGAIDSSMPQGMPRDTLNLVSGEAGTRLHALLMELAWRALQRKEPVVLVCVSDPPIAALHQFLSLKWNVIPHIEAGRLQLIDCYTHRERDSPVDDDLVCGAWGAHLHEVTQKNDAISYVHDPTQPKQFKRHLRTAANDLGMNCRGTIILDSLTELGTLMREIQGYELLKDLRATLAKNRAITLYCGSHYGGYNDEFPHQLEYLFDGVFDLSLNPNLIPGLLIKQLLVRKMRGVMTIREHYSYEFMEYEGLTLINPGGEEAPPEEADAQQAPPGEDGARGQRRGLPENEGPAPPMDNIDDGAGPDSPPR